MQSKKTKQRTYLSNSFKKTLLQGENRNLEKDTNIFLPSPQKRVQNLRQGDLKLSFIETKMEKYCEELQFTLVGKFSFGYLEMKEIIKVFRGFELNGHLQLVCLTPNIFSLSWKMKMIILGFGKKNTIWFNKYLMKVLKWDKDFTIQKESSLAPVWIRLPELPLPLFNKQALVEIA